MTKPWWTSKTIWLGALMILAAIMEYIAGLPAGTSIVQAISGALTIIVRLLTSQSISGTPASKVK